MPYAIARLTTIEPFAVERLYAGRKSGGTMRKSILVALLLSLFIGIAGEASAQLDCTTLIKRLNNTVKAPGAFDVEFFIGKSTVWTTHPVPSPEARSIASGARTRPKQDPWK